MGIFDFLTPKKVNKDIEKWEKRKKNLTLPIKSLFDLSLLYI